MFGADRVLFVQPVHKSAKVPAFASMALQICFCIIYICVCVCVCVFRVRVFKCLNLHILVLLLPETRTFKLSYISVITPSHSRAHSRPEVFAHSLSYNRICLSTRSSVYLLTFVLFCFVFVSFFKCFLILSTRLHRPSRACLVPQVIRADYEHRLMDLVLLGRLNESAHCRNMCVLHIYIYLFIYVYMYIFICMCVVYVCVSSCFVRGLPLYKVNVKGGMHKNFLV